MISAKILDNKQLLEAKSLLFRVYSKELNWLPPKDNPSGWHVKETKEGTYFEDLYKDHGTWFGAFEGDVLRGSVRIIQPREHLLEVEHYFQIPADLKFGRKIAELNRMVVEDHQKNIKTMILLFESAIEHLAHTDTQDLFIATGVPEPTGFCLKIGFEIVGGRNRFKYFASDAFEVSLLHFDLTNKPKVEGLLALCRQLRSS